VWQLRIVRTGGCWRNMALRAPRGACNNYYYYYPGNAVSHDGDVCDDHRQRIEMHSCKAHEKINKKMGNLTPCKIVTPQNIILKLCTRDYVSEVTRHKNFSFSRYSGGFSPNRRNITTLWLFNALHGMQTRYTDDKSVCPSACLSVCLSVCLTVCQTRDLWQNWRKIGPDFYIIRKII